MDSLNTMYREVLKRELTSRCQRNPRYSLRAFARDMDFLPSRLSDILNGKQGLSAKSSIKLAQKLGMNETEQKRFTMSVEASHSRSPKHRESAREALEQQQNDIQYNTLQENIFALVADWYHFALLDLTVTEGFVADFDWIAKRLGISPIAVETAIARLEKIGLLRREKSGWIATTTFPASPSEIPSKAVKQFHSQILEKASMAIHLQAVEDRDFSAVTMAINPDDLPQIKAEIKKFRRSLERRFKAKVRKREVYCFSTQLFSLTEKMKE